LLMVSSYEVALKDFPIIDKDDTLYAATKLMEKYGLDRVVVTEKGKVVGILTTKDIIRKLGLTRTLRATTSLLHVSSFMTSDPIVLPPNEPLIRSCRIMLERRVSSIPLVNKEKEPIALLTKWDLLDVARNEKAPLRNVMTPNPIYIKETDSLLNIRNLMITEGISFLPVVSVDNRLIGIVTVDELAKAFLELHDLLPAKFRKERIHMIRALDIMNRTIPILQQSDTLGMAAALMKEKGIRGVIVMRGNEIVGVVTLTDIVAYLVSKDIVT